jgi:molybdate transport system substrate-binding protein
MNKAARVLAAFLSLAFSAAAGAQAPAPARERIIVSAASSLTDVLTALKPEAEKQVGVELLLNFGASGSLRRQIEEGAPVDVFFSASSEDMDKLEKAGLLESCTRKDLCSNSIVLIGDKTLAPLPKAASSLKPILRSARLLAIGNPDSVPAGRYAVQALKSLGLYSLVEKKLVLGGSVREVLQYVESGSAPLGIIFSSDERALNPCAPTGVVYQFPDSALATPILYPVAAIAASKAKGKAAALVEFLSGSVAREAFANAGFVVR